MYTYTPPPHPTTTGHRGSGKNHHKPPPQATGAGSKGKEERVDNLKGRKEHDHPRRGGGLCDAAPYIYIYLDIYIYTYIYIYMYIYCLYVRKSI